MATKFSTNDPSKLIVQKGSLVSIVLREGMRNMKNKAEARRTVMRALSLGISMDYRVSLDGCWVTFLSQRGVQNLKRHHGWIDNSNVRTRAKVSTTMGSKDELNEFFNPSDSLENIKESLLKKEIDALDSPKAVGASMI